MWTQIPVCKRSQVWGATFTKTKWDCSDVNHKNLHRPTPALLNHVFTMVWVNESLGTIHTDSLLVKMHKKQELAQKAEKKALTLERSIIIFSAEINKWIKPNPNQIDVCYSCECHSGLSKSLSKLHSVKHLRRARLGRTFLSWDFPTSSRGKRVTTVQPRTAALFTQQLQIPSDLLPCRTMSSVWGESGILCFFILF